MDNNEKTVKELRSTIKDLISDDLERLPETLEQLEPKRQAGLSGQALALCYAKK